MGKQDLLKQMVQVATTLDKIGMKKEADVVDNMMKRMASIPFLATVSAAKEKLQEIADDWFKKGSTDRDNRIDKLMVRKYIVDDIKTQVGDLNREFMNSVVTQIAYYYEAGLDPNKGMPMGINF